MKKQELQVFKNQDFGEIRTLQIDDEVWFVGKDVAEILGYSNPSEAIADHIDDEDKLNSKTLLSLKMDLGQRGGWLINESGLYSLIFSSKLPTAKKFKRWVTSEVLPSIRKTGSYSSTPKKEKLSSVNNAARTILPVLAKAGMKAQYQVLLLKQLYQKADVQIPETRLKADEKLYDKTEIAKILGVFSNNGAPHALAIGAVISKIDVSEDEQELTSFERNGHIGVGYQYTESVFEKIKKWLGENGYPKKIPTANKSFAVKYSEVL